MFYSTRPRCLNEQDKYRHKKDKCKTTSDLKYPSLVNINQSLVPEKATKLFIKDGIS